jgi:hypothetical protein
MSLGQLPVSTVSIKLEDVQASTLVDILMQLAALIVPTDPDGRRGINGQREGLAQHKLTSDQFRMLGDLLYRDDDRDEVAADLRIIAPTIHGQLPGDGLETCFDRRI